MQVPPELYDIAADPLERNDLAAGGRDVVGCPDALLGGWFEEVEAERREAIGR